MLGLLPLVLIILAGFIAVFALGGVGAVYAYDNAKQDRIARGVKVNGVDVGGLTSAQAQRKLGAALLDLLIGEELAESGRAVPRVQK